MKMLRVLLTVLVATGIVGCETYESRIHKRCEDMPWTNSEEEVENCVLYSYRYFVNDDTFQVRYDILDMEDVRRGLESVVEDYDDVTNYRYRELAKYIDEFNLRPMLERDKQKLELILEQVRGVEIEQEFLKRTGQLSSTNRGAYDPRRILLFEKPTMQAVFIQKQIEVARASGDLESVEQYDLLLNRRYDHKDIDPDKVDDAKAFVWRSRLVSLRLFGFKVLVGDERPSNNHVEYIEGYRVVEGEPENSPALKAFFPNPTSTTALVVIDSDRVGDGSFGVGIPDVMLEVRDVVSVADLLTEPVVIDAVFPVEVGRVERPPQQKEIQVEIARIRDVDLWEKAPTKEGWVVPFEYKNEKEDNYSVARRYQKTDKHPPEEFRAIEHVAKKWYGGTAGTPSQGSVVEYYRPKKRFAGPLQMRAGSSDYFYGSSDPKRVTVIFPDGETATGYILPGENIFIEEHPYAIAYTQGEKRWWIEREGDSAVFNQRKEVSQSSR